MGDPCPVYIINQFTFSSFRENTNIGKGKNKNFEEQFSSY